MKVQHCNSHNNPNFGMILKTNIGLESTGRGVDQYRRALKYITPLKAPVSVVCRCGTNKIRTLIYSTDGAFVEKAFKTKKFSMNKFKRLAGRLSSWC